MKHTPQRPFVPTGAAKPRPQSGGSAAFKVVQPFVHGGKPITSPPVPRQAAEAAPMAAAPRPSPPPLPLVYEPPADTPPRAQPAAESPGRNEGVQSSRAAETLAPIGQFLHAEAPARGEPAGIDEYAYELPPVEHFIDAEANEPNVAAIGKAPPETGKAGGVPSEEIDTSEWSEADWQQFDWRGAAALGEVSDPEANSAWSETDWEKAPPSSRDVKESAAKAIADALDGIARRIREGDLALPSRGSMGNPSDIAATLAALLGVKR